MSKAVFSIQVHHGKRPGPGVHWDFRVKFPNNDVWSWALPKKRLPSEKERLLAVWVDDKHPISYMSFSGFLPNGDKVELYDVGEVEIITQTKQKLVLKLDGKYTKGIYHFLKIDPNWLVIKG